MSFKLPAASVRHGVPHTGSVDAIQCRWPCLQYARPTFPTCLTAGLEDPTNHNITGASAGGRLKRKQPYELLLATVPARCCDTLPRPRNADDFDETAMAKIQKHPS